MLGLLGHPDGVFIDIAALGAEHLAPKAALELGPDTAIALQLANCILTVESDEARGEAVGDRNIIEYGQYQREALMREALDCQTANEALADPRRIARPEFKAADNRVEIHGAGRDIETAKFAGQAEMQIVDEFVLEMRAAETVRELEAAHAAKPEQIGKPVFDIPQGAFEAFKLTCAGRSFFLLPVIVIDRIDNPGLAPQRRGIAQEERVLRLEMHTFFQELHTPLVIDHGADRIGKMR